MIDNTLATAITVTDFSALEEEPAPYGRAEDAGVIMGTLVAIWQGLQGDLGMAGICVAFVLFRRVLRKRVIWTDVKVKKELLCEFEERWQQRIAEDEIDSLVLRQKLKMQKNRGLLPESKWELSLTIDNWKQNWKADFDKQKKNLGMELRKVEEEEDDEAFKSLKEKIEKEWKQFFNEISNRSQEDFNLKCEKLQVTQNMYTNQLRRTTDIQILRDLIAKEKVLALMAWAQEKAQYENMAEEAIGRPGNLEFLNDIFAPLGVDEIQLELRLGSIFVDYAVKWMGQWYFVEMKEGTTMDQTAQVEEQLSREIDDCKVVRTHKDKLNTYYILQGKLKPSKDEEE